MNDTYTQAWEHLHAMHQEHILQCWEQLTPNEQVIFFQQISDLDRGAFQSQQCWFGSPHNFSGEITPFLDFSISGSLTDRSNGENIIDNGQMGCILLAGGQGTRLGWPGPKGTYPIDPERNRSLYQIFAERTLAKSKQAKRPLSLAIMTSPLNNKATQQHFEDNHFFGLERNQIAFFVQGMLPFLDDQRNLFLEKPGIIASGPDGNGFSLLNFYENGLWEEWKRAGIRYVNMVLVDNPMADPFDAELVGFQVRTQSEIAIKCTFRRDAEEKVGILVNHNGRPTVMEYSEATQDVKTSRKPDGSLQFPCANISLFCFDMGFIHCIAKESRKLLPLHASHKPAIRNGLPIVAWKFERYIFDLLPCAKSAQALLYPREECFAPLKNASGEDSPSTVREALRKMNT